MTRLLMVQASQRALGAAIGALGLSNKAVFAEHAHQPNAGVGSGLEGGNYAEGPDLAPNAAPGAAAGQILTPSKPIADTFLGIG